jgi:hypothetical protein
MAHEVNMEFFMHGITRRNPNKPNWFHHPIHDVESIWWIALRTFYYLQASSIEERRALFPDSGIGSRTGIWLSLSSYDYLCTRPPGIIQDLLYDWLLSINKEHTSMQAGFDENATYRSFDYNNACEASITFLTNIRHALQEIHAQEVLNDQESDEQITDVENIDDRPRKRFKADGNP